jgi:hypothetical protein
MIRPKKLNLTEVPVLKTGILSLSEVVVREKYGVL